jgi:transcriptional regulator with XRE-family HTH domain
MPRKNPVPETEIAIGKRLAELRRDAQWSREELAFHVGRTAELIARVEWGRMPLRYTDAKEFLKAISYGKTMSLSVIRPINPLWLAEGMDPVVLDWPLVLPTTVELGVDVRSSFSHVIKLYRDLILKLVQDPISTRLPEPWLRAYFEKWGKLSKEAHLLRLGGAIVKHLFQSSAEALAPYSQPAQRILDEYHAALVEMHEPAPQANENKSSSVLTALTPQCNSSTVQTEIAKMIQRLKKATEQRGQKASLARFMNVEPPRVSEWLSGGKEPSGDTTLRLLRWVEQQEAQQKQSPGSVSPPPRPTTQSKKSYEKKLKSGLPKT